MLSEAYPFLKQEERRERDEREREEHNSGGRRGAEKRPKKEKRGADRAEADAVAEPEPRCGARESSGCSAGVSKAQQKSVVGATAKGSAASSTSRATEYSGL